MLKKNDEFEMEITGMTSAGSGIGRKDGIAVFVSGTAVGDTVLCHIIKAKKSYAIGKAMRILKPSADRIEPDCPVSEQCGGCCYRHITYEAELRMKEQQVKDAFRRIAHLDVPAEPILGTAETLHYRNKAQYPVQFSKQNGLQIGFYAENSHRVVPCTDCLLQPPVFADVLRVVRDWVVRYRISVYDEAARRGRGLLRHIYIRRGYHSGQIMVCLVVNGANVPHTVPLVEQLKEIPGFTTLTASYNTENTNVVLGKNGDILYGDGFIRDTLLSRTFRISPNSFYQVNTAQAEVLYQKAAEYAGLTGAEVLLDLYCGTGTIGLTMADRAKQLIGVEVVPEAVDDARKNAAENGVSNAAFFCGDAAAAAARLRADGTKPGVILVDPPRKGLDEALVQTIAAWSPDRVVYVSCDPATLARDCARFAALGYAVRRSCPVDLFPRTAHVETVALLTKS